MPSWKPALRALLRRPAFALTTILVLAFGIGANSALFSVVDAVLLKPLPYPDPDRIVQLLEAKQAKNDRESLIAPVRLEDWNRLNLAFQSISGSYTENVTDTSRAEPERLAGRRVGPGYFNQCLRDASAVGTRVSPGGGQVRRSKAAVISEGLWTRRYNRNPSVIWQRLVLAGSGYTIIGVMTKDFASPAIEIWLPAQINPYLMRIREARFYSGVVRLRPGVTIAQGRADLQRVQQRLGEQFPKTDKGWSVIVNDLKVQRLGFTGRPLSLMFAAAALLLLIVCAGARRSNAHRPEDRRRRHQFQIESDTRRQCGRRHDRDVPVLDGRSRYTARDGEFAAGEQPEPGNAGAPR